MVGFKQQKASPRCIAVDTTEFFDCPYLDSPRWNQLRAYLSRTNSTLVVPEVVIVETKRHFRNTLDSLLRGIENQTKKLNRWLRAEEVLCPTLSLEDACREYEVELSRLLAISGAVTPAYSEIPMESIVDRCLEGRKPFDSNGKKGFRDAVIWESILSATEGAREVIFITNNTNDFGAHGGLADSLAEEILGSNRSITICDSLHNFGEEYAKPALDILDSMKPLIERKDFVSDLLHQIVHDFDITDEVRSGLGGDICGGAISELADPEVEVGDIYDLGEGLRSCSVRFHGHGSVEFSEAEYEGRNEPPSFHAGEVPAHLDISVEITFRVKDHTTPELEEFTQEDLQVRFDI